MATRDLAELLAKDKKIKKSVAAEEVHRIVHEILNALRNGRSARLPGLGRFRPGKTPRFQFEKRASNESRGRNR